MKKLLLVFVAMLGLVLAACNGQTEEDASKNPDATETPGETEKPAETPAISKNVMDEAAKATQENMMIEDATAEVDGNTVHLFIGVSDESISVDYAEETGEEFANLLAENYAKENDSAKPLWEQYDLTITIGTDKDNTLWEGSKKTDSETIKWS